MERQAPAAAAPVSRAAGTADSARASRARLRVAWRNGTEVDEELWPAEHFGGVTDEQFWNDLAADKPLTTTARTAHPPSPAAPRTSRAAGRAYQAVAPPSPAAIQPVRTAPQAAGSGGRPRPGPGSGGGSRDLDEDPLTSPAYSLRPKGAVDGRSYQPPRRPMNTPPHGEVYGYPGPGGRAVPGGSPRRPDRAWDPSQPAARTGGNWNRAPRHAFPAADGYRDPYAPWGDNRR